ncbi:hypothetical protein Ndes2437B_g04160 [Nannochloris sp. 'desiccata']
MFKKHINASNTRQLGGKDAKKFRGDVAKFFPNLTEEQTAVLFPPKAGITLSKLSNRSIVYGRDDGVPLFFDPTGHGDKLIPTVYALTLVPTLVPTLYTGSDVSSKVLGGADLFLQGVLLPIDGIKLEPFLAGGIRSISVPGNPIPFAVGTMAVSSTEAAKEGMKGRGLTLLHCYGDLLWVLGPKNYPVPNAGFTIAKILPIEISSNGTNSSSIGVSISAVDEEGSNAVVGSEGGDSTSHGNGIDADSTTSPNAGGDIESPVVEEAGMKLGAINLEETNSPASSSASPTIDIDPLLEAAVLGGLKSVTNAELPLQFGDFYQKHILPLRPEGITFDFKASRKYKKLSKLLDVFEIEKVLIRKQIRKQDHLFSIDRTHPLIVQWKGMPTIPRAVDGTAAATVDATSRGSSTPSRAPSTTSNVSRQGGVQVEYLYKPPTSLRPLFMNSTATCTSEKERLFSEDQVSTALTSYASTNNLIITKQSSSDVYIKLDNLLATSLWGKKEGPEEGSELLQAALFHRLLTKLQQWHRILRPTTTINSSNGGTNTDVVEVIRKGPIRPLSIIAEKRRGRNVTAISHVETFGWSADEIERDYQRRFKTACSVSKLPGKQESDYEILMQGDLLVKVEKHLKEVEGIDGKFILINNKLSGKKKG